MHPLPSASRDSSIPPVSFNAALEDEIAHARRSPVHYDETRSIYEFIESPDFETATRQACAGAQWMEVLLGAHPRWARIREGLDLFHAATSGNSPEQIQAQCFFLGEGKRRIFELCERLEQDRQPATMERVVRSLESDLVLRDHDGSLPDPADVLQRALHAAQDPRRSRTGAMPPEPSAPPMFLSHLSIVAPPSRAPVSIGPSPSVLEQAREQRHFYDGSCGTPAQFLVGPAYEPARRELFLLFQRLRTLLPATGRDQDVAGLVKQHAQTWVGDARNFNRVRAQLFGPGKHAMHQLCLALEADPCAAKQSIVCRHLREAIKTRDPLPESIAVLCALPEVVAAKASEATALPVAAKASDATALPVAAKASDATALPVVDDAVLATILPRLGIDGLRQLRQQLVASIDRLIALMPPGVETAVREGLNAWREGWATPAATFDRCHAEMLFGGQLVLTALTDELDRLDSSQRMEVVVCCERELRDAGQGALAVAGLAHVLLEAERVRSGEDNPHLDARRRLFEAWARPEQGKARLDARVVEDGLQILGLHQPDIVYDGPMPEIDPIRSNAAWLACLGKPGGAIDVHPLADVDRAELAAELTGLKSRCDDLMVADTIGLDLFADRWLGRTPSGAQEDVVGNLRAFGVAALHRLVDRLGTSGDRDVKQAVLARLLKDMATTADPAALLLRYDRYELPQEPTSAAKQAELDRLRRGVVEREVRRRAATLLEGMDSKSVDQAVRQDGRRVLELLGIRAAAGAASAPGTSVGLIDLSAQSLARLEDQIRSAVARSQEGASTSDTRVVATAGPRANVDPTAPPSVGGTG